MAIERLPAPSLAEFRARFLGRRPAIFTGALDGWPALARWSAEDFAARAGDAPVRVAELFGSRLCDDPRLGIRYREEPMRRAVELAARGGHYLVADFDRRLGPLPSEAPPPCYCAGAPRLRSRLWLGAAGTLSPLHRDFPDNLHAQVRGTKRWTILSPRDDDKVYEHSFRSRLPRVSPVDAEAPDLARFPRFRGARPLTFELRAGELLYLPGRWWHQVRTVEPSISVNWWWARGWVRLLVTAADLYKAARGVRL